MAGLVSQGERVALLLADNPGMSIAEAGRRLGISRPHELVRTQKAQRVLSSRKEGKRDKAKTTVDRAASGIRAALKVLDAAVGKVAEDPANADAGQISVAAGTLKTLLPLLGEIESKSALLDGHATDRTAGYERSMRVALRVGYWLGLRAKSMRDK